MVAPNSVTTQDLVRSMAMAASPAADLNLATSLGQGVKVSATTTPGNAANNYNSGSAAGTSAAAPAANSGIAALAVTPGYWEFQVSCGFGGTAETTTVDNFFFNVGAISCRLSAVSVANQMGQPVRVYAQVTSGGFAQVAVGGTAGSSGSIYKAQVVGVRIA